MSKMSDFSEVVSGANHDAFYMQLALAEASKGLGRTAPNPPVGCVIVRSSLPAEPPTKHTAKHTEEPTEECVVGRGHHPKAGEPHAEVFALREAGEQARGATAYVTLEPCSHYGRTPPCALALIEAGVRRVVVAATDPNPQVSGRGLRMLQDAGIEVSQGICAEQAIRQQLGFRSLMHRKRPYVIYKYAMTLDGKTAAKAEGNGRVSGRMAQTQVMRWRNECDAIAVGAGTILADDPQLTTRGMVGGRHPRPVLFDLRGQIPVQARAVRSDSILIGPATLEAKHPKSSVLVQDGRKSLEQILEELSAEYGISSILLEGGSQLASAFMSSELVDEVRVFIAPKMLGAGLSPITLPIRNMAHATPLQGVTVELLGNEPNDKPSDDAHTLGTYTDSTHAPDILVCGHTPSSLLAAFYSDYLC